jgi:hypothetical protein
MKLIPSYFQELETIVQAIQSKDGGCITFFTPKGGEGSSSLVCSIAHRLERTNKRVLIVDLNQFKPMPVEVFGSVETDKIWCFDDISCQTNVIEKPPFSFLSARNMEQSNQIREDETVKQAFIRLRQEFDYILIDMCPLLRVNRLNFPSKIFVDVSTATLLCVSLGVTSEGELSQSMNKLLAEGFTNPKVIVSQFSHPPLGPKLVAKIETLFSKSPRIKSWLSDKTKQQQWLFKSH